MGEATSTDEAAGSEGPGKQGKAGQIYGTVRHESPPSCRGRQSSDENLAFFFFF